MLEPFFQKNGNILFIKLLKWFEQLLFVQELCIEIADGTIKLIEMFFVEFHTFVK